MDYSFRKILIFLAIEPALWSELQAKSYESGREEKGEDG